MNGWVGENSAREVSIIQKRTFCTYYLTKSSGSNDSLREWIILVQRLLAGWTPIFSRPPSIQTNTHAHPHLPVSLIALSYLNITHRWSWCAPPHMVSKVCSALCNVPCKELMHTQVCPGAWKHAVLATVVCFRNKCVWNSCYKTSSLPI